MTDLYFMLACGILGLNIGLSKDEDLTPLTAFVLFLASLIWPIYLAVWAYHRYGKKKP